MEGYLGIAADPRHSELVIVTMSVADTRMYEGWFMGGLGDEREPFVDIEEILRMRHVANPTDDARVLMRRWLALLQDRSTPQSAAGVSTGGD